MPLKKDSSIEKVALVLMDLTALFLAANLAFDLRYYIDWPGIFPKLVREGPAPWGALYHALPYMLLSWFVIFATFGLYQAGLRRRDEISRLIKAQLISFTGLFAVAFFYRGFSYSRLAAFFMMPLAFLFTLGFRTLFRLAKEQLLRLRVVRETVLLVGRTDKSTQLVQRLARPDNSYELVGLLSREGSGEVAGTTRLGLPSELGRVLTRNGGVDRVLLMSGDLGRDELMEAVDACQRHRVQWAVVPDLYDMLVDNLQMEQLAGVPVMGPSGSNIVGLNLVAKRLVDLLVATLLVAALSPFLLLVAALVKLTSSGPVLFVQKRVGRGGRVFTFYKFRSMYTGARDKAHRQQMDKLISDGQAQEKDKRGPVYKMKHDPRITPLGRLLRRFSIDELPQLLNVLRGDMSLVGPRPAIPYEVEKYRESHRRRLEALPGITGLWQVSGRNRLSFEEMVKLDIHYIENWSPGLDTRIFVKTIAAVLFSRGY
ncbi:MAG TPA: sugar transferase [Myxococcota bacterium]|nr:sugar transferase [Myxococcota bacterium]